MANLVSPGVSVTVTDESFFIPAAAPTVPLFFIATAEGKLQPDGVTPAAGTYEHDVIRTVTSLKQSTELYGVPKFLADGSGNQYHGDARNEYGVFALNQFLGVGNRAYVVRANVNLDNDLNSIRDAWDVEIQSAAAVLSGLAQSLIDQYNTTNGYNNTTPAVAGHQVVNVGGAHVGTDVTGLVSGTTYTATISVNGGAPVAISTLGSAAATFTALLGVINTALGVSATATLSGGNIKVTSALLGPTSSISIVNTGADPLFAAPLAGFVAINAAVAGLPSPFKTTITEPEFLSLVGQATSDLFASYTFSPAENDFVNDHTSTPFNVYAIGYALPATGTFLGVTGDALAWVAGNLGSTPNHTTEWTTSEAANTLISSADNFKFTSEFQTDTVFTLGANDAARRVSIVTALQASINSNTDLRSENYEYNLVLCPGFHEVIDELLALVVDIKEEALVLADTPFDKDPSATVTWAGTSSRFHTANVAYYYPHGLASNLDGVNVMCAASGIALRTIAYSDSVSELWFAPAGLRRGTVSGVSLVGYVTGVLGSPTTFTEVALNQGQRDDLYKYFTNINPIVFFPGQGLVVYGNKTSPAAASALDRINVSRLIKYISRQLRKNTMSFVFEPNDQLTRNNLKAVVDGFLGDLVVKRGLYDFVSVCDESNNTPDRIDRNELYIDIAIKPVKAAEFIYIPIRVVSTGTQI
jgi:phage tail sheath protein FI